MSSYKPIDSKREEFRKYLERTGVMDALTKALVALYEETDKPEDALGYIRTYIGGGSNEETVKTLQRQMEEMKIKTEKMDSRTKRDSADQTNLPDLADIKPSGEIKTLGGEDVLTASSKGGGDMGNANEGTVKPVTETIPPEGAA